MEEMLVSYPADGHVATAQIDETSFWYLHRNEAILSLYQKYINNEKQFFDIGGGNGIVAKYLQDAGIDVVLVEPYLEGVEKALQRGVKNVMHKKLEELSTAIAHAGMFDVLEHLEDDKAVLKQLSITQAAGGFIIITVPASNALWSSTDINLGHFRRYSVADLKLKTEAAGYTVLQCSYFFSMLWLPLFFFRVLPQKFGFKKDETKRRASEHVSKQSMKGRLVKWLLSWEIIFIKKGISIPFGTSCIIIAKK